jgi:Tfp pilus assembly pilus retraction ATPase PilT
VTLEDPIEFVHQNRQGVVHQREIGVHVDSMARGVRDALRAGADTIVIGELRDYATLLAVLDAVERGCLVLTTTNSSSVVTALSDLFSFAPVEDLTLLRARVASALRVLIGQTLLRRSHGSGKVPLLEILINNPSVARILRAGDLRELPAAMERHRGLGMQTIDVALRQLLNRNLITVDEALYHAADRSWLAGRGPALAAR